MYVRRYFQKSIFKSLSTICFHSNSSTLHAHPGSCGPFNAYTSMPMPDTSQTINFIYLACPFPSTCSSNFATTELPSFTSGPELGAPFISCRRGSRSGPGERFSVSDRFGRKGTGVVGREERNYNPLARNGTIGIVVLTELAADSSAIREACTTS